MTTYTSKLFGLNIVGVLTWTATVTPWLGMLGALLAVITGGMLLCIRMKDFLASAPVKWLGRKPGLIGRTTHKAQVAMGSVPPWPRD